MWQLTISQRLRLLERRMLELSAWRVALEQPLPDWRMTQPNHPARGIKLGEPWGFTDGTHGYNTHTQGAVIFEANFNVPPSLAGFPIELELDVGGEGFVQISNVGGVIFRGGLNPYHKAFPILEQADGGESFTVRVEAVPKGLFGSRNDAPSLARAHLVAPHLEVKEFLADLEVLHQVAVALEGHEVVPHLINAAEDVLQNLDWTSNAQDYLSRLMHGTLGTDFERSVLWSLPPMPDLKPLEVHWLDGVNMARGQLKTHLEKIKILYPAMGSLALTGHAHIDLAWLWTVSETRRKIRRTFGTVLDLMNKYPDFTFNQSSAQAYAWLEQDDPTMFAQVQARVREGRWEAIGGMWVEPDGQMLSGESWVRQIWYGQRYFLEKFGRTSSVSWLPDTFGFNPQLPQLLHLGGMNSFFTTKLRWNETSEFPHDLFVWQGLDGSTVTAHCFWNVFGSYNAQIEAKSVLGTWQKFKGKASAAWLKHDSPPQSLLAFGYGDGGGGPSREHLEGYARLSNYPAMPKLEMTRVDDFFAKLPTDLPVWHGELYLELHRGTLTTQAKVKQLHRTLEHRLLEAELLWTLAWLKAEATYPHTQLESLWKILLLHQFHDILPGSSIREVYADAHSALETALQETIVLRDTAPKTALQNLLENAQLESTDSQQPENLTVKMLPSGAVQLESDALRVRINASGWLDSVLDKYYNTEYIEQPCTITYQHDVPREWEAWDINPPQTKTIESRVEFAILPHGVRVTHFWRDSVFEQEFRLGVRGVVVQNRVQWNEKRMFVRAEFPIAIRTDKAYFETAFGVVERTTQANTPSQMAAFEVVAHRFVLLQEGQKYMALLNDSKYGFSVSSNVIRMSLLRGTMYPDPTADLGVHKFCYELDYLGDQELTPFVALEAVAERGIEFNSPILAAAGVLVSAGGLILSAIKKSETDDCALLIRWYEPSGKHAPNTLDLRNFAPKRVARVDFLEQELGNLELQNGTVQLEVKPFEVVTLKLWF